MAKRTIEQIQAEIEKLQAEMAEAAQAERADALAEMKRLQKVHMFSKRELGPAFQIDLRGKRKSSRTV